MNVMEPILTSLLTLPIVIPAVAWIVMTLVNKTLKDRERQFDALYKEQGQRLQALLDERKLQVSEITKRRAEIANEAFTFIKRTGGALPLGELVDPSLDVAVACWFPDETYCAFRDYVIKLAYHPTGKGMDWSKDVEPVLQLLVAAVRPDSQILLGARSPYGNYAFLPNLSMENPSPSPAAAMSTGVRRE